MIYTTHNMDWNNPNEIHEVYIWRDNEDGSTDLLAKRWMKEKHTLINDKWMGFRTSNGFGTE